jgi:hypothetical protein
MLKVTGTITYDMGKLIIPVKGNVDFVLQEQEKTNKYNEKHPNKKRPLLCDVRMERPVRSKTANDKCWALCTDLAEVFSEERPTTKEDVYRRFIRETNYYYPVPVVDKAVEQYKRIWESNGLGWIAEEAYKSKIPGFTTIHAYYGSSQYNSLQMSRFIDMIIEECKEQGIETDPAEIARLKQEWGNTTTGKQK